MTVQAQSDLVFAIGLLTLTVLPIVAIAIALVCKACSDLAEWRADRAHDRSIASISDWKVSDNLFLRSTP